MRAAVVASLLLLAACGASTRRARPAAPPPVAPGPRPSSVEAWRGAEAGTPLRLPDGRSATVLSRRVGDAHEVVLSLAGRDGLVTDVLPIATVAVGGVKRREVLTGVTPFALGAETLVRVDVRLFELVAPRFFAVKTALVSVAGDEPRVVLARIVESGNDVIDRRATISARGNGELVVEERATGKAREVRTLVYVRGEGGVYETQDESMFAAE